VCPICDGELAQDAHSEVSSVALGSLSASTENVEFKDLLDAPKLSQSEVEVELAIDLAGRAHTLEDVRMSDLLDLDLDRTKSDGRAVAHARPAPVTPPIISVTQPTERSRFRGLGVYLYLVIFVVLVSGLRYLEVTGEPESNVVVQDKVSKNERLAISSMEQGRYAAAIKFLEQATASGENIDLLPSLALAYTQTSQIERARQVMRSYRSALHKVRIDD
jgi:hypothetical protein